MMRLLPHYLGPMTVTRRKRDLDKGDFAAVPYWSCDAHGPSWDRTCPECCGELGPNRDTEQHPFRATNRTTIQAARHALAA